MRAPTAVAICLVAALAFASAQDPAEGWMAYLKGTSPSGGRITYLEAKWKVPSDPLVGGGFFSPWCGIESSDNLDLLQPVNPWTGSSWAAYDEEFLWNGMRNKNSRAISASAGDVMFARVSFNEKEQTYTASQSNINTGEIVNMTVPVERDDSGDYKKFTILYFVMEKSQWECNQYPPDNKVLFYDVVAEYEYKKVQPKWETLMVDDHCNCRSHVVSESQLAITWESGSQQMSNSSSNAMPPKVYGALSSGVSARARLQQEGRDV